MMGAFVHRGGPAVVGSRLDQLRQRYSPHADINTFYIPGSHEDMPPGLTPHAEDLAFGAWPAAAGGPAPPTLVAARHNAHSHAPLACGEMYAAMLELSACWDAALGPHSPVGEFREIVRDVVEMDYLVRPAVLGGGGAEMSSHLQTESYQGCWGCITHVNAPTGAHHQRLFGGSIRGR